MLFLILLAMKKMISVVMSLMAIINTMMKLIKLAILFSKCMLTIAPIISIPITVPTVRQVTI